MYATFPSLETAESVAAFLIDSRLAACVNILPRMISIYRWGGTRHRDDELVMIIKTRQTLTDRLIAETRKRHPYELPAILVMPLEGGFAPYLSWILAETADSTTS